jgi:hypothetical protein
MSLVDKVIDQALGMNMWVFGGYVRDVIVRGEKKFNDLDLCCPRRTYASDFLRVLSVHHKVESIQKYDMSEYACMSLNIRKVVRCIIDDTLKVDIVVYDGTFRDWQLDQTTDFSCNLFFQSRYVHLGIRYIPESYKMDPNPMRTLIQQTREGIFTRTWDGSDMGCIKKICRRAEKLVSSGMTFRGQLLPFMMDDDYCNATSDSIIQIQHHRSVLTFLDCLNSLQIHLPEEIKNRIVGDLPVDQ